MITKDQYNQWRNRPDTQFFRQFLKDRRESLITTATETWLNNHKTFEAESEVARGRILELFEVADVPFELIEVFYQERENASETIEHKEG